MEIKIIIKITLKIIFFVKTFLKTFLVNSLDEFWSCLKYSLKILNANINSITNNPPKIKKRNGKKEIAQNISPKLKATAKETTKICFLLLKPNNSPARRRINNPRQNIKNETKIKTINPATKLIVWDKIENQIALVKKNIRRGAINRNLFGDIINRYVLIMAF
ncbi:MAG: hypothetical protein Q8P06_01830 [Candidatus Azambacteria bacterium]|nr:hypothetical protein [Candidatus Azambacteria bacterium]